MTMVRSKESSTTTVVRFDGFDVHCSTAFEEHVSLPQKAAHRDLDAGR
jgi:hypothetical protein